MSIPRIVAGVVLVILGIGWLLQTAGIVHFDSNLIAPIALIGIGVALVLGSPRGLHVPLFIAGIVLTAVLAGDTGRLHFNGPNVNVPAERSVERPTSAADLRPYKLGVGRLVVDLTALPLDGETYRVSAHVGTGRLAVYVPPGVSVHINSHAGVGNANVLGRRSNGAGVHSVTDFAYSGRTRFVIDLHVGAGAIVVTRQPHMEAIGA